MKLLCIRVYKLLAHSPYLKISLNEIVDLKILVVIAPRIEQSFSNLDPTDVTNELDDGEEGHKNDWKKRLSC